MGAVNECYLDVYGKTLQESIKSEALMIGDFKKATLAWCQGIDPSGNIEYTTSYCDEKTHAKQALKERENLRDFCASRDAAIIRKACKVYF